MQGGLAPLIPARPRVAVEIDRDACYGRDNISYLTLYASDTGRCVPPLTLYVILGWPITIFASGFRNLLEGFGLVYVFFFMVFSCFGCSWFSWRFSVFLFHFSVFNFLLFLFNIFIFRFYFLFKKFNFFKIWTISSFKKIQIWTILNLHRFWIE
jgi:hypothetical protein